MRRKISRVVALSLATAMTVAMATGCGSDSSSSSSGKKSSNGKGSVYWLNFKPEADEALQDIAKKYEDETGVKVKVVTAASGSYEETLTAEMDKSDAPTLFVVGTSGVGVRISPSPIAWNVINSAKNR